MAFGTGKRTFRAVALAEGERVISLQGQKNSGQRGQTPPAKVDNASWSASQTVNSSIGNNPDGAGRTIMFRSAR